MSDITVKEVSEKCSDYF